MIISRAAAAAALTAVCAALVVASANSFVLLKSARLPAMHSLASVKLHSHERDDVDLPVVWTSRRGMISTCISAAIGSQLLRATGVSAAVAKEASWMAPTGKAFEKARLQLSKEANQAAMLVTPEIRQEYKRDGVTVVRNAVSQRWIETLREACEDAQDNPGPYGEYLHKPTDDGIFFADLELARRLPTFSAFAQYGPCAAVAGAVMGSSSVRYLYDQLFIKEPGVSTVTPWHQDGGYWRIKGQQIGSVFVPLDPVEMGDGLDFVIGSQDWELHNPQHFADGTPYTGTALPKMPNIDKMVNDGTVELKSFSLQPGDVQIFSSRTVHGGPGNWGRALSTRWTGDSATFWDRPGEGAVPTGDVGLQDGELLAHNGAAFPEVWKSAA